MGGGAPEVEPAERSGHTRTCAHTSGTCAKRTARPPTPATPSASRGTPGRLLTLVSHTHILSPAHAHQAFYTLTRRRTPCAHTKDTPPCTHKARLALPTNSHSDIPQGHHGEGRAGLGTAHPEASLLPPTHGLLDFGKGALTSHKGRRGHSHLMPTLSVRPVPV